MTNREIMQIAMTQQAIDLNCDPADFTREENIVVLSKPHENARKYLNQPFFCDFASIDKEKAMEYMR